ncbi:MAG: superoxide dismutase family protein [Pseudanabaena sp.]
MKSHNFPSRLTSKFTALLSCTTMTMIATTTVAIAQTTQPTASSRIFNVKGELVGTATFIQTPLGVKVDLKVQNLAQGEHMVHLHEKGKCDAPDFKTSGDHFDPMDEEEDATHLHHKHNESKHKPAGDLPNIIVKQDGNGSLTAILPKLTLGSGRNSLLKHGGTSILIHAGANGKSTIPNVDYKTRIACGIIKP